MMRRSWQIGCGSVTIHSSCCLKGTANISVLKSSYFGMNSLTFERIYGHEHTKESRAPRAYRPHQVDQWLVQDLIPSFILQSCSMYSNAEGKGASEVRTSTISACQEALFAKGLEARGIGGTEDVENVSLSHKT